MQYGVCLMKKILALDLGDVWTGTALSDELRIIAQPYQTIKTAQIEQFLREILLQESIDIVVVGYPRTLRGSVSEQTKKTEKLKDQLEKKFDKVSWVLWDERFTSKHAKVIQKRRKNGDRNREHSLAAALILDSYLEYCRLHL